MHEMNAWLENNAEFTKSHLKLNLAAKVLKLAWQHQLGSKVYCGRCDAECVYMMWYGWNHGINMEKSLIQYQLNIKTESYQK